jgi:predicted transcriptional regulator
MPNFRRSKIELYVDVLRAVYNGRRSPSRVVYAANLSYDRVMKCIDFLLEQGLVKRIDEEERKRYVVTERGKEVVRYFDEVESALFYRKKAISNVNIHYAQ